MRDSRVFMHSDLYKTPGVTPKKTYDHKCAGCKVEFSDGSHNTKRCVKCRKPRAKVPDFC